MATNTTRADDMRLLNILHDLEELQLGTLVVRDKYRLTRGQLAGIRDRFLRGKAILPCACRKPENRDGGMRPKWWAK